MRPSEIEPEWVREREITSRFGLTRTVLYNLRKSGAIRSTSLRSEGAKYGIRIFHVGSIRDFITKQEAREIEEKSQSDRM